MKENETTNSKYLLSENLVSTSTSNRSLQQACSIDGLYQWVYDVESSFFLLSSGLKDLLLSEETLSLDDFNEKIIPSDRELFQKSFRSSPVRELVVLLVRMNLDEVERVLLINGSIVKTGDKVLLTGFIKDMTDSIESDYQKRLSLRLLENSYEGIIITDMNGLVESVNPAFTMLTDHKRYDFLKENFFEFLESFENYTIEEIQGLLFERGHWIGKCRIKNTNKEVIPVALTISIVSDGNGHNRNLMFLIHEIEGSGFSHEKYLYRTFHDSLTDLPNRQLMIDRLSLSIQQAKRRMMKTAIILIDLDNFRSVNDSLGHDVGDELIRQVASRFRYCIRRSDTLARFGEDEFAFIINDLKETGDVIKIINEAQSIFSTPFFLDNHEVYSSACFGIAFFPDDALDVSNLIKFADSAMNRAKNEGSGNYRFFTKEINESIVQRLQMESRIRKALENEEFLVYYQPKVDMTTGVSVGVEALVRWNDPEKGIISPAMFIPIAEASGLIKILGQWVLRQACLEIKEYQRETHPHLKLNVNLSAKQFKQKDLVDIVKNIIDETGFDSNDLCLEITESIIMENSDEATKRMQEIRDLGVDLSLDDFGTGYSSLAYLSRFPISELKIDQSFITNIERGGEDTTIASAIINMGHSLNLHVVAEGVETLEQLDFLGKESCDQIQGYYYSRPLPLIDLKTYFAPYEYVKPSNV